MPSLERAVERRQRLAALQAAPSGLLSSVQRRVPVRHRRRSAAGRRPPQIPASQSSLAAPRIRRRSPARAARRRRGGARQQAAARPSTCPGRREPAVRGERWRSRGGAATRPRSGGARGRDARVMARLAARRGGLRPELAGRVRRLWRGWRLGSPGAAGRPPWPSRARPRRWAATGTTARASRAPRACRCRPRCTRWPASQSRTRKRASRSRAPVSPVELGDGVHDAPAEHDGMAGRAVVDGAHGVVAVELVERARDHLRRDERLVAERDHDASASGERGHAARAARTAWPVLPVLADRRPRRRRRRRAAMISVRGVAEHDEHRSSAARASISSIAYSSSGRPRRSASCLVPPKRRPAPAARIRPGGHAMPSSMSSASASSEAIELPGSSRLTCGIAAFMPRVSGS